MVLMIVKKLISWLLILFSLLFGGFFYSNIPDAIIGALKDRNIRVMTMAEAHQFSPTQEGVLAFAISTFASSFILTSTLNGYTILSETPTMVKVLVDESVTIHWGVDSQFGNMDIITLKKVKDGYKPIDIVWWADLREYLYGPEHLPPGMDHYKDIVSWNKRWIPMLMKVPSVTLTSTQMNSIPPTPAKVYTPTLAAYWMLQHTYPIGSFKVPMWYSTYFKYFPGDDCANSVSQSLYVGGMRPDKIWHPYTPAWIYVPKLWEYLIAHGWHKIPCTQARIGDVLLFDVNRSGTPEHATLITGEFMGRALYTGHTSHKKNMPVPLNEDMWWCYTRR